MTDEIEIKLESTRGKRLQQKQNHIKKQTKIAKAHNNDVKQPHRFAKVHAMNCGQPNCVMCGNPRKVWGELTMQEKRFKQDTGD